MLKKRSVYALLSSMITLCAYAATEYEIEISHNDEIFIINGEKYEAKTYCFSMEEGDKVIFIKGSASGVCVSAEILNLRTKNTCKVWCE
jgi:aspartate 1-decarboxylase